MAMQRCEQCGGGWATTRRYADGRYTLCWDCRVARSQEREKVQAAAYRMRKRVIRERGQRCQQCGEETKNLHLHHVKRVVDGGDNSDTNLLLLCVSCHRAQHHGYIR